MKTIRARDVRSALDLGIRMLAAEGQRQESRAGPVLVMPCPVVTVTANPYQRVLVDPARDANPFFHLFEAIWMMAGRDDATYLDRWVRDFSSRFAEAGGVQHGAYGARWRGNWDFDQLTWARDRLRINPSDRRVVISMWDPTYDMLVPGDDGIRDLPCNTHMYPRVVGGALDLTVCCRSNDAIWGAHGANAVHFSIVQEWLALSLGLRVGTLYQLSNNYHAYEEPLNKLLTRWDGEVPLPGGYERTEPITDTPDTFLGDCEIFCRAVGHDSVSTLAPDRICSSFLTHTAWPMYIAHQRWRRGEKDRALEACGRISAEDWRRAAYEWIDRRKI